MSFLSYLSWRCETAQLLAIRELFYNIFPITNTIPLLPRDARDGSGYLSIYAFMNQIIGLEKVWIIYSFHKIPPSSHFTGDFQECDVICTPLLFSHVIYCAHPKIQDLNGCPAPSLQREFSRRGECFNGQLNQKLIIRTALM